MLPELRDIEDEEYREIVPLLSEQQSDPWLLGRKKNLVV